LILFNFYSGEIIMRMRTLSSVKQRGFSILTGFILAIIMFGSLAFFLAGQGINTGFGALYSNISRVSSLLTSAGYITTGFAAITLGGTDPANVTFSNTNTSSTVGIFNPVSGGVMQQTLDPSMFQLRDVTTDPTNPQLQSTDGFWIYRANFSAVAPATPPVVRLNGVGIDANADYVIMASGLKKGVCSQINTTLHGTSTIPSTGLSDAALVGPATGGSAVSKSNPVSATTADLTGVADIARWMSGCVEGTANNYVYFHTVLAQ
jgi:hypothetical protein